MDKKIRITQNFNIMEFEYPFAEKMNPLLEQEIRDSGDVQNRETLCKCDMTDFVMRTPAFNSFKKYVIECVSKNCPHHTMWDGSWEISNIWGLIYKKGEYAVEHDHYPAIYSFVYYVNCPPGASPLKFHGYSIKPKNGMMTIFPSNLKHWVPKHKINSERVVISGNLNVSTDFIRKHFSNPCH